MCPAIHITSRSWLRSSSTHEPSDPPLRVVQEFAENFFSLPRNNERFPYTDRIMTRKKMRRAGRRARGSPFFEPSRAAGTNRRRVPAAALPVRRRSNDRDRPAANGTGTPTRSNNRVRRYRETRSTVQADRDRPLSVRVSCGFDRPTTQQRALRRAAQR